jgi:tetrapyrrole methylase family protein/MazG family protein
MCEEFGDLLLQIVLHAQIASESGEFNMSDILRGINEKIVRRHPHVFGEIKVDSTEGVLVNWERLKAEERARTGKQKPACWMVCSLALPALAQAEQYQMRAARVGFDWPDIQGVIDKFQEELDEVQDASDARQRAEEIGDLLFRWSIWRAGIKLIRKALYGRPISASASASTTSNNRRAGKGNISQI